LWYSRSECRCVAFDLSAKIPASTEPIVHSMLTRSEHICAVRVSAAVRSARGGRLCCTMKGRGSQLAKIHSTLH
jgi:hypothetical protein